MKNFLVIPGLNQSLKPAQYTITLIRYPVPSGRFGTLYITRPLSPSEEVQAQVTILDIVSKVDWLLFL
jgi:hypothetical protein